MQLLKTMTKDFAKSSNKDRSSKDRNMRTTKTNTDSSSASSIKPFITGSIFGICLCLGAQWFFAQNQDNLEQPLAESLSTETVTGPILTFYDDLRNVEVLVPQESIIDESEEVLYLLQAGSFREKGDADSVRAQLILLNLSAEIRQFNNNGEIWHRVIVGPFAERSMMAKTRTTLLENKIESLLLTQPVEK